MGIRVFETNFDNIGKQEFLRPNFGYRYFFDEQDAIIYDYEKLIKLKYVLKEIQTKKMPKGDLEEEEYLVDICNIERRFNNLINLEKVVEIGSDKNILQDGDIIIPKMQPQMGNIFLNKHHKRFIASTELLEYSISNNFNAAFVYYLITSNKFLIDLAKLESGKTHRRVNSTDLLKIKIPNISLSKQDQIVAKIEPIEKRIKELKAQIKQPQEVINKVFAREFNFDLDEFDTLKQERIFFVDLFAINTKLIRSTTIQNSPRANFIKYFFRKIDNIQLKDFLTKDIARGKQPDYKDKGIKVVKTINISKNGSVIFDLDNTTYVSESFARSSEEKLARRNDILLSSTGMGRGKFALYDFDEQSLVDSHVSIIRFDDNKISPLFFNYFCQSFFGSEQLRYIEMQIKGTPEIYSEQLKDFQVPNLPLHHQQKIVDEIKQELDSQEEIKKIIESERSKIDEIIEKSITS